MCLRDVGQQGATLAAGRVSECLLRLWWMITRKVECPFCVVSSSWQPLEDMGAEGATFGPVLRVGGRGKKVARWEGCVPAVEGSRGKVIGDVSTTSSLFPVSTMSHACFAPAYLST